MISLICTQVVCSGRLSATDSVHYHSKAKWNPAFDTTPTGNFHLRFLCMFYWFCCLSHRINMYQCFRFCNCVFSSQNQKQEPSGRKLINVFICLTQILLQHSRNTTGINQKAHQWQKLCCKWWSFNKVFIRGFTVVISTYNKLINTQ